MVLSMKLGYKYLMRSAEISGLEELDKIDETNEQADEQKKAEVKKSNQVIMNVMMAAAQCSGGGFGRGSFYVSSH